MDTVARAARALRAEFDVAVRAGVVTLRTSEVFVPARAVTGLDAVRDCMAAALRAATFDDTVVVRGAATRETVFAALRVVAALDVVDDVLVAV